VSEGRPLHVRVAEALGCKPIRLVDHAWHCDCNRERGEFFHGERFDGFLAGRLLRYDTDWSATGPLIERFLFDIFAGSPGPRPSEHWSARADRVEGEPQMNGETPLVAVCNLILALHADGKLSVTP